MNDNAGKKNSLLKDTILFILFMPVVMLMLPIVAVIPIIMGFAKIFGLVDRPNPPR